MNLLLPLLLVLTNGPDANVTEPADPRIPWRMVADNTAWTACGPRLVCSAGHVFPPDPVFNGQGYHVIQQILPPGSDVRFGVVDRDLPAYAPIYSPTNGWPQLSHIWIVGGGVGTGRIEGSNYYWGAEGFWPEGSKRKRWGWASLCTCVPDLHYFIWTFVQAASSSGDSGYAVFTADGQYVGPIAFGCDNPTPIMCPSSGGKLAGTYLEYIKDWLPTNSVPVHPPKPVAPTGIKVISIP